VHVIRVLGRRGLIQANFGESTFYEFGCISLVSASKKKPMEKESASFTMRMLSS
jgi:hypothetical protein